MDDRIFKITKNYCLFNGDILSYDKIGKKFLPIDNNKVSKVNPTGDSEFTQSCNEYHIGLILKKHPQFLIAEKCEEIKRIKEGTKYIYNSNRDEYIFNKCDETIYNSREKNSNKVEVYVYQKSGKDLEYYFNNLTEMEKLLTKNNTISIYDGICSLMIYFINILIILRKENVVHKDIKPENIIVGENYDIFPENIKIIDLGFSFEYKNLSDYILSQSKKLYNDIIPSDSKNMSAKEFAIDFYNNWDSKYDKFEEIFSLISNVGTPGYTAPEYEWIKSTCMGSLLSTSTSHGLAALYMKRDIPIYIINNEANIDYTELCEFFLSDAPENETIPEIAVKNKEIQDFFINSRIDYNTYTNRNYNFYEYIYLLANGLTGPDPIIYKYDLYAFGLIFKKLIDIYGDHIIKEKIKSGSRRYHKMKLKTKKKKAKKKKTKKKKSSKKKTKKKKRIKSKLRIIEDKIDLGGLDRINNIITNMINEDCIYRWSVDELSLYLHGGTIDTNRFINIKGEDYLLSSTSITRDSIISQMKHILPDLTTYVPMKIKEGFPKQKIKEELEKLAKSPINGKIRRLINDILKLMEKNNIHSLDDPKIKNPDIFIQSKLDKLEK